MKYLSEIKEKDIGISEQGIEGCYNIRRAARAILLNDKKETCYQFISRDNYHKLPGGGIEDGESIEQALKREIKEEVGCDISIKEPLGVIIEYRNKDRMLQISYCYIAEVLGEIGEPKHDDLEIKEGLQVFWGSIEELIDKMGKDSPVNYMGKFIKARDMIFLKKYLTL